MKMLQAFLWTLLAMLSTNASAAASCSWTTTMSANPSLPSNIYVRNNYAAGERLFATLLTAGFSCTGNSSEDVAFGIPTISNDVTIPGTGVSYRSGDSPSGIQNGRIVVTTGTCSGTLLSVGTLKLSWPSGTTSTCTGTIYLSILFYANAAAPTGSIPVDLPTDTGFLGWIVALRCTPGCGSFPGAAAPTLLKSAVPINLVALTKTCSFSSSSLSVQLPKVSTAAFTGIGSVAGSTRLPISITCTGAQAGVGIDLILVFQTTLGSSGTGGSILSPSSGASTGLSFQFTDAAHTPISTGSGVRLTNSMAAGPYDPAISVSYYQSGATVTAGSLSGTATYFLQYY